MQSADEGSDTFKMSTKALSTFNSEARVYTRVRLALRGVRIGIDTGDYLAIVYIEKMDNDKSVLALKRSAGLG